MNSMTTHSRFFRSFVSLFLCSFVRFFVITEFILICLFLVFACLVVIVARRTDVASKMSLEDLVYVRVGARNHADGDDLFGGTRPICDGFLEERTFSRLWDLIGFLGFGGGSD